MKKIIIAASLIAFILSANATVDATANTEPANLQNLAIGAQVSQSSTAYGGVATRAQDTVTDGRFVINGQTTSNSVTHTGLDQNAWWEADLRKSSPVTGIVVWNRTDCCTTRLSNYYVFVSDAPFASKDLQTTLQQPGVKSYKFDDAPSPSQTISLTGSARYVRVQLTGTDFLSLAEVQIFSNQPMAPIDGQKWVADNPFGMFTHYGMGTYTNQQWADPQTPATTFNPTGTVDPTQWANAAKSAGMTFGVLTAKHHDGFALWPTTYSAYNISASPYQAGKGDLVRDYVAAMRAAGLKVGIYFSIWDRHNGDNTELVQNQLRELLTQYGPIDYLWFDGWSWQVPYSQIPFQPVRDLIRNISPTTVLANNDKLVSDATSDIIEYELPNPGETPPNTSDPKEGCDVLDSNGTWFNTDKTGAPKSSQSIVTRLNELNATNTAYLLNVGPGKSGQISQADEQRLAEIGSLRTRTTETQKILNQ